MWDVYLIDVSSARMVKCLRNVSKYRAISAVQNWESEDGILIAFPAAWEIDALSLCGLPESFLDRDYQSPTYR